jgi:hypothetical protein
MDSRPWSVHYTATMLSEPVPMPHRLMRSPRVERLTFNSAAARDLFPPVTCSAHLIRFASNSLSRSSSEIGVGSNPPPASGCP